MHRDDYGISSFTRLSSNSHHGPLLTMHSPVRFSKIHVVRVCMPLIKDRHLVFIKDAKQVEMYRFHSSASTRQSTCTVQHTAAALAYLLCAPAAAMRSHTRGSGRLCVCVQRRRRRVLRAKDWCGTGWQTHMHTPRRAAHLLAMAAEGADSSVRSEAGAVLGGYTADELVPTR